MISDGGHTEDESIEQHLEVNSELRDMMQVQLQASESESKNVHE